MGDDDGLAAYGGDAEAAGMGPAGGTGTGGGGAGAPGGAAGGPDPVKEAEDNAWLAQFRADNAASVAAYDRAELEKTEFDLATERSKRERELHLAAGHDEAAKIHGQVADEYEQKAAKDARRHDEYEVVVETARHHAAEETAAARTARAEAAKADAAAAKLDAEANEELDIAGNADADFRALQDAAVAARRIAEDERRVQGGHQPGTPPPGTQPPGTLGSGGQARP